MCCVANPALHPKHQGAGSSFRKENGDLAEDLRYLAPKEVRANKCPSDELAASSRNRRPLTTCPTRKRPLIHAVPLKSQVPDSVIHGFGKTTATLAWQWKTLYEVAGSLGQRICHSK